MPMARFCWGLVVLGRDEVIRGWVWEQTCQDCRRYSVLQYVQKYGSFLRIEYGWGYVWHNECNIYYEISVISARLPAS